MRGGDNFSHNKRLQQRRRRNYKCEYIKKNRVASILSSINTFKKVTKLDVDALTTFTLRAFVNENSHIFTKAYTHKKTHKKWKM